MTKEQIKTTKVTPKGGKPTNKKDTKKVTKPVDKSVDKSVDNSKATFTIKHPKDVDESIIKLQKAVLECAEEILKKDINTAKFNKFKLDNFNHARPHVCMNNIKDRITCNGYSQKDIVDWSQHMSVIIGDELQKSIKSSIFRVEA